MFSSMYSIHQNSIPSNQKEKRARTENIFEEIMTENSSNLVKEKRYTSPGSTESPKQDEPKEAHTKTHHK